MKNLTLMALIAPIALTNVGCATADVERFMGGLAAAGKNQQTQQAYQPVNQNAPKQYQCTTRTVGSPWGVQRQVVQCQ